MKKWIINLLTLVVSCCISCTQEELVVADDVNEGEKITFTMGVDVPEMRKASNLRSFQDKLGDNEYPSLWLVVFDASGYLREYAKAENFTREGNITKFDVTLRASSKKRIIHFLLNYADDLHLEFGHESAVIGDLVADNRRDVYWQRKELSSLEEETVSKTLQKVPLIRNFAKITVNNRDSKNLTITGYALWHKATNGTVAPYSHGHFVEYTDAEGKQKEYSTLVNGGYKGFISDDVKYDQTIPSADADWIAPGTASFLYEHVATNNEESAFSLLIKGHRTGEPDSYYRADLVNFTDGIAVPIHVLRNFAYTFNVKSVSAAGSKTVEEAIAGVANNNLSGSVVVQGLRNISDGKSALYVSYVDKVLVSTDPITLQYKYVPDITQKDKTANGSVKFKWGEGEDREIFETNIINDKANGWATLTLTPKNEMPIYPIDQSLMVYIEGQGEGDAPVLYREVRYELRPTFDMHIECVPKEVKANPGEEVSVKVYLPNGLNKVIFPLTFQIEAQGRNNITAVDQYISPHRDENMSVILGPSIVGGLKGRNSYHYEKTLDYTDYLNLDLVNNETERVFPCKFITTRKNSASFVYVDNQYFTKQVDHFDNRNVHLISPTLVLDEACPTNRYGNQKVQLFFSTLQEGRYTLSSPNGSFTVNNVEGYGVEQSGNDIIVSKPGISSISCTMDWGTPLYGKIEGQNAMAEVHGSEPRNVLYTKLVSGKRKPEENRKVTLKINGQTVEEKYWSEWTSGLGIEIPCDNLQEGDICTFSYTKWYNYKADFKASDLANKKKVVNFERL